MTIEADDPLLDDARAFFAEFDDGALARALPWAVVVTELVDDGPLSLRPDAPHRLGGADGALLAWDADLLDPRTTDGRIGPQVLHVGGWDDTGSTVADSFPHHLGAAATTARDPAWQGTLDVGQARALVARVAIAFPTYVDPDHEAFVATVLGDQPDAHDAADELGYIAPGTLAVVGPRVTGIGHDSRWGAPGGEGLWVPLVTAYSDDAAQLLIADSGWLCVHRHVDDAAATWASVASS